MVVKVFLYTQNKHGSQRVYVLRKIRLEQVTLGGQIITTTVCFSVGNKYYHHVFFFFLFLSLLFRYIYMSQKHFSFVLKYFS